VIQNRRFHRTAFVLAGVYNLAWGAWTALDPQWFFQFAGMAPLNHPSIYACVGMVVGLYGFVYLEIARAPERAFVLGAVGLAGKVLGPIGMAQQILLGGWPWKSALLCVTNDVIWWIPFILYLRDAWPAFKREIQSGAQSAGVGDSLRREGR
jgi:hypothetical protein